MFGESKRAKVTGVTLNIVNADGSSRVVSIDPRMTEGVFWTDQAVVDVLGTFYDKKDKPTLMSKKDFIERYGEKAGVDLFEKILKEQGACLDTEREDCIRLDKKAIKTIWNNEFPNPGLEPYMIKTKDCKVW